MIIKHTYIAADGEEFETEEECLEHERVCDPGDSVVLYYSDCDRITDGRDIIEMFERADHIYVRDAEQAKIFFNWINEETGMDIPHNVADNTIYSYDGLRAAYFNLNEAIEELLDISNAIFNDIHGVEKGAE